MKKATKSRAAQSKARGPLKAKARAPLKAKARAPLKAKARPAADAAKNKKKTSKKPTKKASTGRKPPSTDETIRIAVDPETKRTLEELASQRHGGNLSALVAEMATDAVRKAELERALRGYGGQRPMDDEVTQVDAELDEGWSLDDEQTAKDERA
jgi:hypothetical protein